MARKRPVAIWMIRHRPRSEPKFHQTEILEGAGRSARASLAIFNSGCVFRRLVIIVLVVGSQQWFISHEPWREPGKNHDLFNVYTYIRPCVWSCSSCI